MTAPLAPEMTKEEELVERVAKAIQRVNALRMLTHDPWEGLGDPERSHWLLLAEVAITEMCRRIQ